MTTAPEFLAKRAEVVKFLQEGRFKRQADATSAAETLISFIADGVPFPSKPEQTTLPLAVVAEESEETEESDEDE